MSRFHGILDVEGMRADRFVELAVRLVHYDGVTANLARAEASGTTPASAPVEAAPASAAVLTAEMMASPAYGAAPQLGQEVPLFEHAVV